MIIYLNQDWQDEWGVRLELWDKNKKGIVQSVAPVYNRCVIFNTDADSFHSHPDPLLTSDSKTRRSLALHYYMASKHIYEDTVSHDTINKVRPNDDKQTRKLAISYNLENQLRDVTPPFLYRVYRKIKDRLKK